jgi:hypothetical protein
MTEADDTPYLFRKWSAISLVAGALERRVWTIVGHRGGEKRQTFPNLYVFLVGSPGVGKYIINTIQDLWRDITEPGTTNKALHVADSNMTKASMVDSLAESIRSFMPPKGPPYEYHSLLVAAEEFGVFLPSYDTNFIAVLNDIYNASSVYSERRRHGPAKEVNIQNPLLNILGGVQPVWMNSVFPKEAWGMGLFSRVIMIYAAGGEPIDPFAEGSYRPIERKLLTQVLAKLSIMHGELKWSPEAQKMLTEWHMKGGPQAPTHSRLEHYCRRRTLHAIKLAMVSSVSRANKVDIIETTDVARAIDWLIEAEKVMPDIFRSMIGQSDHEVIEELYNHMVNLYAMSKGKPIHEHQMISFLIRRVPSEKISAIISAAERANMITRIGGTDTYRPEDRREFVE